MITIKFTRKALNKTIAEFANTVDPDEMAHNDPGPPLWIRTYCIGISQVTNAILYDIILLWCDVLRRN